MMDRELEHTICNHRLQDQWDLQGLGAYSLNLRIQPPGMPPSLEPRR